MTLTKTQKIERDQAREDLLKWLKPGDTVYTILRSISRSGMQRSIGVVLMKTSDNGEIIDLHPNYNVAKILGRRQGKDDGIICHGGGMDMGFELVYSLSAALFGHENRGGYALNQRWL